MWWRSCCSGVSSPAAAGAEGRAARHRCGDAGTPLVRQPAEDAGTTEPMLAPLRFGAMEDGWMGRLSASRQ